MSEAHSAISKITAEALLVRFLGIFFMIFHTSQIWGNLISSLGINISNLIVIFRKVSKTAIVLKYVKTKIGLGFFKFKILPMLPIRVSYQGFHIGLHLCS